MACCFCSRIDDVTALFKWVLSIDDALAISFIGFVLLEPGVIFQIGFQLSYLATASLLYSGIIFKQTRTWLGRSFYHIRVPTARLPTITPSFL